MPAYSNLQPGEPAPYFRARTTTNPTYAFDTVGGRYVVLCFFMVGTDPIAREALAVIEQRRQMFDDVNACLFGVSCRPADEHEGVVRDQIPGIRIFWDVDGQIGRLYGALPRDAAGGAKVAVRRFWMVLDPTLRVMRVMPFEGGAKDAHAVLDYVASLPPPSRFAGFEVSAPILVLPNVFEPALCARLISLYETNGGTESGFMREIGGRTVAVTDHSHKRRRDYTVEDPELLRTLQNRVQRRVVPEIRKVHQFEVTRMERYIVSCYAAEDAGHFNAHRDNTTKGTAHRRFAVSVNLNAEFEGGEVSFPEYGPRSYKPPPGAAVVFSCSLLHAVSVVTRGRRYAFLPFLYDEAAARIREANNSFLGEGVEKYQAIVGTETGAATGGS